MVAGPGTPCVADEFGIARFKELAAALPGQGRRPMRPVPGKIGSLIMNATTLSETKRRLLERYLREDAKASVVHVSEVVPAVGNALAPVSLSQEQLLLREQRNQDGPALYNECIRLRMEGPLDVLILERSLTEIIQRHEIWRTSFDVAEGQLVQVVHQGPEKINLTVVDLQGLTQSRADAEMERVAGEMVERPFDLKRGPLLRAKLFRISGD